jgi:hypothetical protein
MASSVTFTLTLGFPRRCSSRVLTFFYQITHSAAAERREREGKGSGEREEEREEEEEEPPFVEEKSSDGSEEQCGLEFGSNLRSDDYRGEM